MAKTREERAALYKKLDESMSKLMQLEKEKIQTMKKLCEAYRMQSIWPECFGKEGKAELFTTKLGGTGNVPLTRKYYLERTEDKVKIELTLDQYNYIKSIEKDDRKK